MLCEKSFIDSESISDTMCRQCEVSGEKCLYDPPDKSICLIYDEYIWKLVNGKDI